MGDFPKFGHIYYPDIKWIYTAYTHFNFVVLLHCKTYNIFDQILDNGSESHMCFGGNADVFLKYFFDVIENFSLEVHTKLRIILENVILFLW